MSSPSNHRPPSTSLRGPFSTLLPLWHLHMTTKPLPLGMCIASHHQMVYLTYVFSFQNGSILIATLRPSFTILHSLSTNRKPCRINGLAWHGSSGKQKSEMLATQAVDGDLRVWSIPRGHHEGENATVIRVLNKHEGPQPGPTWFAWSKNGRIVQHCDR